MNFFMGSHRSMLSIDCYFNNAKYLTMLLQILRVKWYCKVMGKLVQVIFRHLRG
jgi:hypothetical protein